VSQVHDGFVRDMLKITQIDGSGQHAPLTVWEETQLLFGWLRKTQLEKAVKDHNDGCAANCGRNNECNANYFGCQSYLSRKIQCPNCPMDDVIEVDGIGFTAETATEPVMPKYYATCCKCKKVIAVDAPPQGIFYCGYGCT
jgi:hypothetical protein